MHLSLFTSTMRKKVNRQKRMEYLLMRYKKGGVHKLHDWGDARQILPKL